MIFSQAVHSNLSTAYFLGPDIAVILLNVPQVHVVKLSSGQDLHNHLIEYCKPVSPFLVFRSISIFSVVTSSVVCRVKAMGFLLVMYRCESIQRWLSTEELMFLNCGAGEDSGESHG